MSQEKLLSIGEKLLKKTSESIGFDLPRKSFCVMPFNHLSTTTSGQIRLCCRSKPIGSIKKQSLVEVWNGQKLQEIRQDMIKGIRPHECEACWSLEEKGIMSLRIGQNIDTLGRFAKAIKKWIDRKPIPLATLDLKLSNLCNLKCLMCYPMASTLWLKTWEKVEHLYDKYHRNWVNSVIKENDLMKKPVLDVFSNNKNFISDFQKIAPEIMQLDFAGGEPLIDPLHYKALKMILDKGDPSRTILRYSTNLTALSFEKFNVLNFWERFKEIHLTISIDGSPRLNEYIRKNMESGVFEENLEKIKNIYFFSKKIRLKGTTTISAFNAMKLAETAEYIVNDLKIPWHTSRVTSPKFLDARIWQEELVKKAVEDLRNLKEKKYWFDEDSKIRFDRHIQASISWLESKVQNEDEMRKKFKEYISLIDKLYGRSFGDIVPVFKKI